MGKECEEGQNATTRVQEGGVKVAGWATWRG